MASPPKNPRNRRARSERRVEGSDGGYAGPERRQGPRRKADLPRPLWQQPLAVLTAAALGVLAALHLDHLPGFEPEIAAAVEPPPPPAIEPIEPDPAPIVVIDPEQLAAAQAMRDEAERLTVAAVTLDERAHERWLPRIARIEAVRSDPSTPELVRTELDATIEALARVGLL